jgi:hypothetical protein
VPGREDFGKVRLDSLDDPRLVAAASLLKTPIATVCGVISLLGGTLARAGDDGVIRGDLSTYIVRYTGYPDPKKLTQVLKQKKLLRKVPGGWYLAGFRDCYGSMVTRRQKDAASKAALRARGVSAGRPADGRQDVRAQRREEESREEEPPRTPPPTPEPSPADHDTTSGNGSSAGSSLPAPFLAELSLAGVRLHGRAGVSLAVWTGAIASLLDSGASQPDVLAALKASQPCDPPHVALQHLQQRHGTARLRIGSRPPADPAIAARYDALDDAPSTPPQDHGPGW